MLNNCTLEKRFYKALVAQKEYELVRSESRSGFNLCEDELKQLDSAISPLLKNGQSIHHIIANNQDRISCCEKTAYIYADNGLFSAKNIDMPRKVRFKPRKKKSVPLKVLINLAELAGIMKIINFTDKTILRSLLLNLIL